MKAQLARRAGGFLWVIPALVLLLVFVYYPIVDNVRLSLYRWNAFSPGPMLVGLDNYQRVCS